MNEEKKEKTRADQYREFMRMLTHLFIFIESFKWPVRLGEAHRPKEMAEIYAREGRGIRNSKHIYSLAIDLWIYDTENPKQIIWINKDDSKNNEKQKEAKRILNTLGNIWEELGGKWGGNFRNLYDPYHFEYPEKPL